MLLAGCLRSSLKVVAGNSARDRGFFNVIERSEGRLVRNLSLFLSLSCSSQSRELPNRVNKQSTTSHMWPVFTYISLVTDWLVGWFVGWFHTLVSTHTTHARKLTNAGRTPPMVYTERNVERIQVLVLVENSRCIYLSDRLV